jgi:hypothetical protein
MGAAMRLRLSSKEFIFEQGKLVLMPRDFDAKSGIALVERINRETLVTLVNNTVELTDVIHPGDYRLLITELTVQRAADHFTGFIPMFALGMSIRRQDLDSGEVKLEISAEGLFKVTILDHEERPIPHRRLTFHADMFNMSIKSDETGTFLFLGNPCLWWIELDRDTGLRIVPV